MWGFILVFIAGMMFYLGNANQQLLLQRLPSLISVTGSLIALALAGISLSVEYSVAVSLLLIVGSLSLTFILLPILLAFYVRESEAMLLSSTRIQLAELSAQQQQMYR